jgi:hypothetical protein
MLRCAQFRRNCGRIFTTEHTESTEKIREEENAARGAQFRTIASQSA